MSFEISERTINRRTREDRFNDLTTALELHTVEKWDETESFVIFESASSIDLLGAAFKACIAPSVDRIVIRYMNRPSARICGDYHDNKIQKFMPYLKAL